MALFNKIQLNKSKYIVIDTKYSKRLLKNKCFELGIYDKDKNLIIKNNVKENVDIENIICIMNYNGIYLSSNYSNKSKENKQIFSDDLLLIMEILIKDKVMSTDMIIFDNSEDYDVNILSCFEILKNLSYCTMYTSIIEHNLFQTRYFDFTFLQLDCESE
jgi:hypothetical protein